MVAESDGLKRTGGSKSHFFQSLNHGPIEIAAI